MSRPVGPFTREYPEDSELQRAYYKRIVREFGSIKAYCEAMRNMNAKEFRDYQKSIDSSRRWRQS